MVLLPNRPIAFVLAQTRHGNMIVNRNDQALGANGVGYGVGFQLLENGQFDPEEVQLALNLLSVRRACHGDGVVAVDGGANIGVHTLEWARHMHGWGSVLSFEAQEVVFYALAGNIALNNCLNARARFAALGEAPSEMLVPQPDYFRRASFGSMELRQRPNTEKIGQPISYADADCVAVPLVNLDSLSLERLDFLKLDVEGMELDVLRGARGVMARCHPILLVEWIKSDRKAIEAELAAAGYRSYAIGINLLAVHEADPCSANIQGKDGQLTVHVPQRAG